MHDLTEGSIPRHIVRLAVPMAIGMIFQTLYYLVDLYFVAKLGDTAIAGVSAAGDLQFVVLALTQVLGIGTMVLIAHEPIRRDVDLGLELPLLEARRAADHRPRVAIAELIPATSRTSRLVIRVGVAPPCRTHSAPL